MVHFDIVVFQIDHDPSRFRRRSYSSAFALVESFLLCWRDGGSGGRSSSGFVEFFPVGEIVLEIIFLLLRRTLALRYDLFSDSRHLLLLLFVVVIVDNKKVLSFALVFCFRRRSGCGWRRKRSLRARAGGSEFGCGGRGGLSSERRRRARFGLSLRLSSKAFFAMSG